MSVYLTIRKNGSEICSFNTNSGIGQFISEVMGSNNGEWAEVNFSNVFDDLKEDYTERKTNIQNNMNLYFMMLNTPQNFEDRLQVCKDIQDDIEMLKELEDMWSQVCMLNGICEHTIWDDDKGALVNKIEWKYE